MCRARRAPPKLSCWQRGERNRRGGANARGVAHERVAAWAPGQKQSGHRQRRHRRSETGDATLNHAAMFRHVNQRWRSNGCPWRRRPLRWSALAALLPHGPQTSAPRGSALAAHAISRPAVVRPNQAKKRRSRAWRSPAHARANAQKKRGASWLSRGQGSSWRTGAGQTRPRPAHSEANEMFAQGPGLAKPALPQPCPTLKLSSNSTKPLW